MPNENTPENIKRLRQKIGLTQKECAEIFSMSPRTGVAKKNLSELQAVQHLHQ
nr:hypothetical protein [Escherichia coli]